MTLHSLALAKTLPPSDSTEYSLSGLLDSGVPLCYVEEYHLPIDWQKISADRNPVGLDSGRYLPSVSEAGVLLHVSSAGELTGRYAIAPGSLLESIHTWTRKWSTAACDAGISPARLSWLGTLLASSMQNWCTLPAPLVRHLSHCSLPFRNYLTTHGAIPNT